MLDFYTSFEYQHDELLKYIQKASASADARLGVQKL